MVPATEEVIAASRPASRFSKVDFPAFGRPTIATSKPSRTRSATPPPSAHSGTRLWGTVLDDCYTPIGNNADACNNANVGDDSVLSLTFVLPSPLLNPKLEWWEWNDYFLDFDWTEVRINNTVVYQDCTGSHSKPTAWRKQSVDLSAYAGQTLTVTFHFMASSAVNYAGWYLDDIAVTAGP